MLSIVDNHTTVNILMLKYRIAKIIIGTIEIAGMNKRLAYVLCA